MAHLDDDGVRGAEPPGAGAENTHDEIGNDRLGTDTSEHPHDIAINPLTPQFRKEHESPLKSLLGLIQLAPGEDYLVRNIALSGPYGSGKSSVLFELQRRLGQGAVNVSLSSLSTVDPALDEAADRQGKPLPTTNFIQKEVVKQLLYRELPRDLPESRYSRTATRGNGADISFGAGLALMWVLIAGTSGLRQNLADSFFQGNERAAWAIIAVIAFLTACAGYKLFEYLKRRVDIQSVTAGPTAVTLKDRDTYYFDEYLDEIVYYFETSHAQVVIFEDIDRFDDTHILESLRNLNVILNNSKQIARQVYFVYAVRDSIFGSQQAARGRRRAVDYSGSRTKFFDAIVPLVPFITYRTAADLLHDEAATLRPKPQAQVLSTVAEHISDMRLLRNIVNEYRFFAADLLRPGHLEDLTPSALFAMVTYKNLAPADFELIRAGDSALDDFFDQMSKLISERIRLGDVRAAKLENELSLQPNFSSGALLRRLSTLLERAEIVNRAVWNTTVTNAVQIDGKSLRTADENRPALIEALASAESITLGNLTLTHAQAETMAGGPFSRTRVIDEAENERRREIETLDRRRRFLVSADMSQILRTGEQFETLVGRKPARAILTALLGEYAELWEQLITQRYIDENFVLYTARYYGTSLSADGMTFMIRNVQRNRPDFDRKFKRVKDIETILEQRGDSFLTEDAALNLSIVDHLLDSNRNIEPLLARFSEPDEPAREFLSALIRSEFSVRLWTEVSRRWDKALRFLANAEGVSPDRMLDLLSSTLENASTQDLDETTSSFVRARADDLPALTRNLTDAAADRIARFFRKTEAAVEDLAAVVEPVRSALVDGGTWMVTRSNLLNALGTDSVPTLEFMQSDARAVFDRVVATPGELLSARSSSDQPLVTTTTALALLLRNTAEEDASTIESIAGAAVGHVEVAELRDMPVPAWPALLRNKLVRLTALNFEAYFEAYPGTDVLDEAAITAALSGGGAFVDDTPSASTSLATRIINTPRLDSAVRLSLVDSMDASLNMRIEDLVVAASPLLGPLSAEGKLVDNATTLMRAIEFGPEAVTSLAVHSANWSANLAAVSPVPSADILKGVLSSPEVPTENMLGLVSLMRQWGVNKEELATTAAVMLTKRSRTLLPVQDVAWLAQHGRDTAAVVALLAKISETLGAPEIYSVTNLLGGSFARLSEPKSGWVLLPNTPDVEQVVNRLKDVGNVTTVSDQDERLRVTITV